MAQPIQVNVERVVIDKELYLKVVGPLVNKTMLYHSPVDKFTAECFEEREIRTVSQNNFYFGVIVRGGMKILAEATGELWTDGEVHNYHLQEIFGVRPVTINKGSTQFTSFEITNEHLKAAFKELDWDVTLVEGLKPRSSAFDKSMFSALIELCLRYYAHYHKATLYETSKGQQLRKELFGTA